jgi:hypothetical protein
MAALQPAVSGSPTKQRAIHDWLHSRLMKQLHDTHQYAFQHLKVTCNRMKAHYDHLANSAEFQEEDQVKLYSLTQLRRKLKSCLSCSHPEKGITNWLTGSSM